MNEEAKSITILMADDDEDDRLMAEVALKEAKLLNPIRFVKDGEELLDYLYRRGIYGNGTDAPRPGLILLDLNLPKKSGKDVLETIKSDEKLKHIPVVVLTSSKAELDVVKSYNLHANGYIIKPVNMEKFMEIVQSIEQFWFNIVVLPDKGDVTGVS